MAQNSVRVIGETASNPIGPALDDAEFEVSIGTWQERVNSFGYSTRGRRGVTLSRRA